MLQDYYLMMFFNFVIYLAEIIDNYNWQLPKSILT